MSNKCSPETNAALATMDGTVAELDRARLKYKSEIDGTNTTVANIEAQLQQALYYLDNTTLTAPEDGRIINLQVRPGMVSGIVRVGGIAAFIADADRYVLATFFQENSEICKSRPTGRGLARPLSRSDFQWKGDQIWRGNGIGQFLPSDDIPKFQQPPASTAQGQYAVKNLSGRFLSIPKFSIGAQGSAAI